VTWVRLYRRNSLIGLKAYLPRLSSTTGLFVLAWFSNDCRLAIFVRGGRGSRTRLKDVKALSRTSWVMSASSMGVTTFTDHLALGGGQQCSDAAHHRNVRHHEIRS